MKVLLTIEEGFAKTIFDGDKDAVEWFLKGFQYARKTNLESPEVIGLITNMEVIGLIVGDKTHQYTQGVLSAMENKKGKLEVIE
jgi:hypothetical protein